MASAAKINYIASLERGSKKHRCPQCGRKTLHRYVNNRTGEYLPEQYGRCDRVNHCAYYLSPYNDGFIDALKTEYKPAAPVAPRKPVFIPTDIVLNRIKSFEQNTFIRNLATESIHVPYPFDLADLREVIKLYSLGTITAEYMAGAICFPFIDIHKNVRAVQCKVFDETNHTIKGRTNWLDSIIADHYKEKGTELPAWLAMYRKNELKVSCLFGEHLLSRYPRNPVAIVEAPKTCVIASLYFGLPKNDTDRIWLAAGAKDYLRLNRCAVLKNRDVYLYPDLSVNGKTFDDWENQAQEFSDTIPGATFTMIDTLEKHATEADRIAGADLADMLIKLDWRTFRNKTVSQSKPYPANDWSDITNAELAELNGMINEVLQRGAPRLPDGSGNVQGFINKHLQPLRNKQDIAAHIAELIKFISLN